MRELIASVSEELTVGRHDAEMVVAGLLARPRHELYLGDGMSARERARVLRQVAQLKRGMPIEYITRRVQFRDHALAVHRGVFIPRPETEQLVEHIRQSVRRAPARILEIGTGCGPIAISLACLYPDARLAATDISARALANARENIARHGLTSRIDLVRCDKYGGITGTFDLIVANPPYIPRGRLASLPRSVRDFEPRAALDGGERGVEFVEQLIDQGRSYLAAGGIMAFEIDEDATCLLRTFLEADHFRPYAIRRDLSGRDRFLLIGTDHAHG